MQEKIFPLIGAIVSIGIFVFTALKRGAYRSKKWTRFSPSEFVTEDDDPLRFYSTLAISGFFAIFFILLSAGVLSPKYLDYLNCLSPKYFKECPLKK